MAVINSQYVVAMDEDEEGDELTAFPLPHLVLPQVGERLGVWPVCVVTVTGVRARQRHLEARTERLHVTPGEDLFVDKGSTYHQCLFLKS